VRQDNRTGGINVKAAVGQTGRPGQMGLASTSDGTVWLVIYERRTVQLDKSDRPAKMTVVDLLMLNL
jgi:hypothetical protein